MSVPAEERRSLRIAGFAGIAFSILSLAILPLALPPPPAISTTASELAAYYIAHRTGFLIGNYLGIVAFVPGLMQLAIFAARVRRLEGSSGWLASFVLGAGIFTYSIFAGSLVVFQALPFFATRSEVGMATMNTLAQIWFALDGLVAVALTVAVGWAAFATGALPRWFGYASGVVTLLVLVMSLGAFTETPSWLAAGGAATALGFVGFFVWTLAWSIVMLRQARVSTS